MDYLDKRQRPPKFLPSTMPHGSYTSRTATDKFTAEVISLDSEDARSVPRNLTSLPPLLGSSSTNFHGRHMILSGDFEEGLDSDFALARPRDLLSCGKPNPRRSPVSEITDRFSNSDTFRVSTPAAKDQREPELEEDELEDETEEDHTSMFMNDDDGMPPPPLSDSPVDDMESSFAESDVSSVSSSDSPLVSPVNMFRPVPSRELAHLRGSKDVTATPQKTFRPKALTFSAKKAYTPPKKLTSLARLSRTASSSAFGKSNDSMPSLDHSLSPQSATLFSSLDHSLSPQSATLFSGSPRRRALTPLERRVNPRLEVLSPLNAAALASAAASPPKLVLSQSSDFRDFLPDEDRGSFQRYSKDSYPPALRSSPSPRLRRKDVLSPEDRKSTRWSGRSPSSSIISSSPRFSSLSRGEKKRKSPFLPKRVLTKSSPRSSSTRPGTAQPLSSTSPHIRRLPIQRSHSLSALGPHTHRPRKVSRTAREMQSPGATCRKIDEDFEQDDDIPCFSLRQYSEPPRPQTAIGTARSHSRRKGARSMPGSRAHTPTDDVSRSSSPLLPDQDAMLCRSQKVKKRRAPISQSSARDPDVRYSRLHDAGKTFRHNGCEAIDVDTAAEMIRGNYDHFYDEIHFIDTRYEWEYDGGHIRPAAVPSGTCTRTVSNIQDFREFERRWFCEEQLGDWHAAKDKKDFEKFTRRRICFVFHCEYSGKRGPSMWSAVRGHDRDAHGVKGFQELFYPEVFLMRGGYKEFVKAYPELCDPHNGYVPMSCSSEHHTEALKRLKRLPGSKKR